MKPARILVLSLVMAACAITARAQASYPSLPTTGASGTSNQQQISSDLSQGPFFGGRTGEKPTPGVLQLGLAGAIDRGLRNNLGLVEANYGTQSARATKLKSLADMLPSLIGDLRATSQQVNLAAFGLSGVPGLPTVVGPFQVVDARAFFTENFELKSFNGYRSGQQSERAAQFGVQDARELVVLVVGGLYLQAIADAARVQTAQAQLNTATALFNQAADMKRAGTAAGIDVLRAQVEMQAAQQRLRAAQNESEKQKLRLARAIGLPIGQQFALADQVPYAPVPQITLEHALEVAYATRPDVRAAEARLRSAELNKRSMESEALPSFELSGDYGAIGPRPSTLNGTYTAAAGIRVPIFQGGRVRADVLQADSLLKQRQAEADDLHSRVEFEVRSAMLDVQAAADQVAVAEQARVVAADALQQARDRFAAGVSNSLEVVQAQQALTTAEENYISSLNAHNVAKLLLVRSLGIAEREVKNYLKGNASGSQP